MAELSDASTQPPSGNHHPDAEEVAARLERLPMTKHQWWMFIIIALAWLFDSMDLAALTFILAPISEEYGLSGATAGALASLSFGGMVVGASFAGALADRFGRRPVFTTSLLVWGAGSLLAALSWDVTSLMVARLIIGIGMGAEFPVAQALLSEFVPSKQRGKFLGWLEGFWPIGFIVCGVLALFLVPNFGWRTIFFVLAGCSLFALVVRLGLPESPRWQVAAGRSQDAQRTLIKFEKSVEKAHGRPLPPADPAVHASSAIGSTKRPLTVLFSPEYRHRTIMMWLVWLCVLLGYYGITTWIAALLAESGMSTAESTGMVVLMALWGIPGFLIASVLLDRIARKPVISGFILASAVAAYVYGGAATTTELLITGSIMQFFFFGMWSALYAYTPEVFPNRARATGCGTSSSMGRVGALLGPVIVPVVLAAYGTQAAFIVAGLFFILGALIIVFFLPETKNRVLEEVSSG